MSIHPTDLNEIRILRCDQSIYRTFTHTTVKCSTVSVMAMQFLSLVVVYVCWHNIPTYSSTYTLRSLVINTIGLHNNLIGIPIASLLNQN